MINLHDFAIDIKIRYNPKNFSIVHAKKIRPTCVGYYITSHVIWDHIFRFFHRRGIAAISTVEMALSYWDGSSWWNAARTRMYLEQDAAWFGLCYDPCIRRYK